MEKENISSMVMFLVLGYKIHKRRQILHHSKGDLIREHTDPLDPLCAMFHFSWWGAGDSVKVCR